MTPEEIINMKEVSIGSQKLTYAEAKKIVDNSQIINDGTKMSFVKGCFNNIYFNARERMSLVWLDKKVRI